MPCPNIFPFYTNLPAKKLNDGISPGKVVLYYGHAGTQKISPG